MNMKDMFLESSSGFMMPFAASEEDEVQIALGYGEQTHPKTGEPFNHKGIDFVAPDLPLFALATGTVIGAGTDAIYENYIVTRYGKFEVKYGHVAEGYVTYGKPVVAGQQIARSGDFVHIGVSYSGESLDPTEFLGMIYGNMMQLASLGVKGSYRLANMGVDVRTDYDSDKDEIVNLMLRFLPAYMNDIRTGAYMPSARMEGSLRNIFAQSSSRNYFFEAIPDLGNPLGLSGRSAPLASKVQNLLIEDFLKYMASKHNVFLSSWNNEQKKNF